MFSLTDASVRLPSIVLSSACGIMAASMFCAASARFTRGATESLRAEAERRQETTDPEAKRGQWHNENETLNATCHAESSHDGYDGSLIFSNQADR